MQSRVYHFPGYIRETSLFLFDSVLPFLISPGHTFAIFPTRRRGGFDSVLPTRPDFYEVFLPILPFPLSLSSCPLPTYRPLSAIRRIQHVILRREYVTRGRAKRQTSNQGARRDGSLRADAGAKGRKNIPESSAESTSIHWFQIISSLSILFIIDGRDFLKEILANSCNMICERR